MRLFSGDTPGLYHVAVFEFKGRRKIRLRAYVRFYPSEYQVCMHHVHAASGKEAKRMAMAEHRAACMKGRK